MKRNLFVLVAGIFLMTSIACGNSPTAPSVVRCQDAKASNFGEVGDCIPWPAQPPAESYVKIVSMAPPSGSTRPYLEYPGPGGVSAGQTELVLEWGISQADQEEAKQVGGGIHILACFSITATPVPTDRGVLGCVSDDVTVYGKRTFGPYMAEKFRGVITQTQYIVIEMYRVPSTTTFVPNRTISIQYLPWVLNFN
jgi:hypothetical protein